LGLAACRFIVEGHGGHIHVQSKLGEGTSFHIYLPAAQAEWERSFLHKRAKVRTRRVLVMEPEEITGNVLYRMLQRLGYEPAVVRDGLEAVHLYEKAEQERRPFVAAILAETVPGGVGGREALTRLREMDPETRAILSTGSAQDPVAARYRQWGFRQVIVKPFTLEDLAQALNSLRGRACRMALAGAV